LIWLSLIMYFLVRIIFFFLFFKNESKQNIQNLPILLGSFFSKL
jgi:hypothetical protein